MARKRKGGGRPFGKDGPVSSRATDNSKLTVNSYEDVPDSEDEFLINRDKVLFDEGPEAKRRRRAQERDAQLELSDEEVLAATESGDSSDEDDIYEDAEEELKGNDEELKNGKFANTLLDQSSEESAVEEDDKDLGGWGSSRKDYYNADINETEQDAIEEETEARRLQKKQLASMTEADFGIDEAAWLQESKNESKSGRVVREKLPVLRLTADTSSEERLQILRTRYPEFEPLAKEFIELQDLHAELKSTTQPVREVLESTNGDSDPSTFLPNSVLKYRSLTAYLSALSMYFALLTSTARAKTDEMTAMDSETLHDHDLMHTLVEVNDLWVRIRDLSDSEPQSLLPADVLDAKPNGPDVSMTNGDAIGLLGNGNAPNSRKRKKKSKTQRALEARAAEEEKTRVQREKDAEASFADLSQLVNPSVDSSKATSIDKRISQDSDSDIGDPTTLTAAEAADKAKRKKSLRFYTSQIAQKSNKRSAAGRDAGGDDDLPYRERWKEKQERLQAEAEKRGKKAALPGADLGAASESEDGAPNDLRKQDGATHEPDEEDEYYDFVAAQAERKKAAKAARAAATSDANAQRTFDDNELTGDGKRAISYAIEKNKGLAPKRKKEVRNPRVKKRKKYDEKKKKLGSMKPIWKGGEGRGGYAGELTGIKSNLVKGVKL